MISGARIRCPAVRRSPKGAKKLRKVPAALTREVGANTIRARFLVKAAHSSVSSSSRRRYRTKAARAAAERYARPAGNGLEGAPLDPSVQRLTFRRASARPWRVPIALRPEESGQSPSPLEVYSS